MISSHPDNAHAFPIPVASGACDHGVTAAVRHFREMGLKEASVRNWKNAYQQTESKDQGCATWGSSVLYVIKALPGKTASQVSLYGSLSPQILFQSMTIVLTPRKFVHLRQLKNSQTSCTASSDQAGLVWCRIIS